MRKFLNETTALSRDERGAAAVVLAVSALGLVGMVALAIDVGSWYSTARRTQTAADSAAMSAAFEVANLGDPTTNATVKEKVRAAALREAKNNGFTGTSCGVNGDNPSAPCQVYSPPSADTGHSADANSAQVKLTQNTNTFFGAVFGANPTVAANSVMQASASNYDNTANSGGGTGFCLLALDATAVDAMYIYNNATVNCGVAANSTAATYALEVKQNAGVVGNLYTMGGASILNNATVKGNSYASSNTATYIANGGVLTGIASKSQTAMPDPYATWEPSNTVYAQTCAETLYNGGNAFVDSNNQTITLHPGHYCQGWDFGNGGTINLEAGVYVVDTKLHIGNTSSSKITKFNARPAGGVTIILNGNFGMDLGNNTKYYIEAPTSGDYKGVAIYSRRTNHKCYSGESVCKNANDEITQAFPNNNISHIQGVVYAPSQTIQVSNNGAIVEATQCTQLIGNKVSVNNNGQVGTLWAACNSTAAGTTDIKTASGAAHKAKTLQ